MQNMLKELLGKTGIRRLVFPGIAILVVTAGCGIPVAGLQPEYPPVERRTFSILTEFVEVSSLEPTLRWEPFPRPIDRKAGEEGGLDRIGEVTYELRLWKTTTGESAELVYARGGLKVPHHILEKPLEPGTRYLWSVRAGFTVDGHFQVIEWGLAGYLLRGQTVPNDSCFRFQTPENAPPPEFFTRGTRLRRVCVRRA